MDHMSEPNRRTVLATTAAAGAVVLSGDARGVPVPPPSVTG